MHLRPKKTRTHCALQAPERVPCLPEGARQASGALEFSQSSVRCRRFPAPSDVRGQQRGWFGVGVRLDKEGRARQGREPDCTSLFGAKDTAASFPWTGLSAPGAGGGAPFL